VTGAPETFRRSRPASPTALNEAEFRGRADREAFSSGLALRFPTMRRPILDSLSSLGIKVCAVVGNRPRNDREAREFLWLDLGQRCVRALAHALVSSVAS